MTAERDISYFNYGFSSSQNNGNVTGQAIHYEACLRSIPGHRDADHGHGGQFISGQNGRVLG